MPAHRGRAVHEGWRGHRGGASRAASGQVVAGRVGYQRRQGISHYERQADMPRLALLCGQHRWPASANLSAPQYV